VGNLGLEVNSLGNLGFSAAECCSVHVAVGLVAGKSLLTRTEHGSPSLLPDSCEERRLWSPSASVLLHSATSKSSSECDAKQSAENAKDLGKLATFGSSDCSGSFAHDNVCAKLSVLSVAPPVATGTLSVACALSTTSWRNFGNEGGASIFISASFSSASRSCRKLFDLHAEACWNKFSATLPHAGSRGPGGAESTPKKSFRLARSNCCMGMRNLFCSCSAETAEA